MHILISYDIKNDTRRSKIFDTLKNYGEPIQYSVFECDISRKQYRELRERLEPLIDVEETDSLYVFRLCGECRKKAERIGGRVARDNAAMII